MLFQTGSKSLDGIPLVNRQLHCRIRVLDCLGKDLFLRGIEREIGDKVCDGHSTGTASS